LAISNLHKLLTEHHFGCESAFLTVDAVRVPLPC
jgi:hypothetical protein